MSAGRRIGLGPAGCKAYFGHSSNRSGKFSDPLFSRSRIVRAPAQSEAGCCHLFGAIVLGHPYFARIWPPPPGSSVFCSKIEGVIQSKVPEVSCGHFLD